LNRCRRLLAKKNLQAAPQASGTIKRRLAMLESAPEIGRPFANHPELRALLISFGDSGHVALYRYVLGEDVVYVQAFRPQKEAG
jgi:plasmid stabilization system protein ParE